MVSSGGILRRAPPTKRSSTIQYDMDTSGHGYESNSACNSGSGGRRTASLNSGRSSQSTVGSIAASRSSSTAGSRSTASTVPYALHYQPKVPVVNERREHWSQVHGVRKPDTGNDDLRNKMTEDPVRAAGRDLSGAGAPSATDRTSFMPARSASCRVISPPATREHAYDSRVGFSTVVASSRAGRAVTAPSGPRPSATAGSIRLATAHGGTRGGHSPLPSPASTKVYEGCPACGNESAAGRNDFGKPLVTEKRGVAFGGVAQKGQDVKLARELWEFGGKHARLAKDLRRYMRGEQVEDPVSLAEYLKSKMGVLDAEEALKRERDRRRNAAEGERRKVQSERREKEYHARDERAKRGAELELAQREAMLARRAEEEKKDDDGLKRRRETEERRREQDVEELICKEDERIKLVDESSRAREVKRRETAAVRQEKDYLEVVTKESAKRAVRKAWEEEVRRAAERSDPQVVRADPGNPSVMKGHSKMIAPYAMQQRPMLARLGRWKHPADDLPDYTTAQPLHNQSFFLVREQRKKLSAEQADVRAFDRGFYVSRQWEAAH